MASTLKLPIVDRLPLGTASKSRKFERGLQ